MSTALPETVAMKAEKIKIQKRRLKYKDANPIVKVIKEITSNGMTLTQLAAACGLNYQTLNNACVRNRISFMTMMALKSKGIINEKTEKEYYEWLRGQKNNRKTKSE